jgi:hypothetical protein
MGGVGGGGGGGGGGVGGAAPKPPRFTAFYPPEWAIKNEGRPWRPPLPFRPLSRSLGLLLSIALSRPPR